MSVYAISWAIQPAVTHIECCGSAFWLAHIDKLLPYAPLITASIAIIAGSAAITSIVVTKKIARRRAAIDFFLKTEMDQSMLNLYDECQKNLKTVNASIRPDTTIEQLMAITGYGPVRTYLNIHELIAVGIKNSVFDKKVCYQFWSAVLVLHAKQTTALVDFCRRNPEEAAVYLQFTNLAKKWERKVEWWRWRQSWYPAFMKNTAIVPATLPPLPPVAGVKPDAAVVAAVAAADAAASSEIAANAAAEAARHALDAKRQTSPSPAGPDPDVEAAGKSPAQPDQAPKP
jgi:hypothetical protein